MNDRDSRSSLSTGMTWADALSRFPLWVIAGAAVTLVGFLIYAAEFADDQFELGVLGRFGPIASSGATASALPSGAVVAFDAPCRADQGWAPFEEGAGKFLLGAGAGRLVYRGEHHRPPNVDNVVSLKPVEPGDQGGGETHTLTEAEMPPHFHRNPTRGGNNSRTETGNPWSVESSGKGNYEYDERRTQISGGGDPHNNMPPYIAIYFCKMGN